MFARPATRALQTYTHLLLSLPCGLRHRTHCGDGDWLVHGRFIIALILSYNALFVNTIGRMPVATHATTNGSVPLTLKVIKANFYSTAVYKVVSLQFLLIVQISLSSRLILAQILFGRILMQ